MKRLFSSRKVFIEKLAVQLKYYYASESQVHTFGLATFIFICMLLYTLQRSYNPFVHDSAYYWSLSNSFILNESFSLFNFNNDLRGYSFPFLLFILKTLAVFLRTDAKTFFYIFSSLFFTILSIYILPWFTNTLFSWKKKLGGRAVCGFLIFFFWRGYFLYPLSDFPAFASLLIGITLFVRAMRNPTNLVMPIVSGFFLGMAINIRPIYQASLFLLLATVPMILWKMYKNQILLWLAFFILGCTIVLFPQYQINKIHLQNKSPWVQARYGSDESLYVKQLFWGLKTQKFESNIGDNYPSIAVIYEDPFVLNLQKTNLLREKTLPRYFKIMQRYPLEMFVSYFRHMFNGLDIFFSTPYIKNIYASHVLLSVVNYLIWFVLIFRFLKADCTQLDYLVVVSVISLLIPVILAIPTAVEVRFFLPAHLLAYGVTAFGINLTSLEKSLLQNKWSLIRFIMLGVFWVMLCFTLSTATIENLV
jgi:hypothetical protein